ncbi:hypothetical protein AVEN_255874-1 [Araneus ventricosus]|uniref:RNase H type-1 domain-containing protein n=1 Tax=Araneus ventricosus TaxID=182803 RepID=A0A4Y2DDJ0_ARAVE|nr:hypothetical protein AVEN_255874-1 [Araneus ventricosus]
MDLKPSLEGSTTMVEKATIMNLNATCVQELMSEIKGLITKLECVQDKCDLMICECNTIRKRAMFLSEETIPLLFEPKSTSTLLEDLKNEYLELTLRLPYSPPLRVAHATTPRKSGVRPVFGDGPKEPHHYYCAIGLARASLLIRQPLIRELAEPPDGCIPTIVWSEGFKPLLLSHKHIHLRWLKVHVGNLDNECADQLAKEAIPKGDPFFLPKPLSYLKSEIRSAALSIRQDNFDNEETGRSTHDIVPRVSNKPVGWNREELMFVTGHGPFASNLHCFNLRTHGNCSCGEKGDPMHYATKCRFTLS